jgi:hypothetical protein
MSAISSISSLIIEKLLSFDDMLDSEPSTKDKRRNIKEQDKKEFGISRNCHFLGIWSYDADKMREQNKSKDVLV